MSAALWTLVGGGSADTHARQWENPVWRACWHSSVIIHHGDKRFFFCPPIHQPPPPHTHTPVLVQEWLHHPGHIYCSNGELWARPKGQICPSLCCFTHAWSSGQLLIAPSSEARLHEKKGSQSPRYWIYQNKQMKTQIEVAGALCHLQKEKQFYQSMTRATNRERNNERHVLPSSAASQHKMMGQKKKILESGAIYLARLSGLWSIIKWLAAFDALEYSSNCVFPHKQSVAGRPKANNDHWMTRKQNKY